MSKFHIFVSGLAVGAVLTGTAAYAYGSRVLLWSAYMEAAADAQANVTVLSELSAGNPERATYYLEKYLQTNEAVLTGCKHGLCAAQSAPEVEKAINMVYQYREAQLDGNP